MNIQEVCKSCPDATSLSIIFEIDHCDISNISFIIVVYMANKIMFWLLALVSPNFSPMQVLCHRCCISALRVLSYCYRKDIPDTELPGIIRNNF